MFADVGGCEAQVAVMTNQLLGLAMQCGVSRRSLTHALPSAALQQSWRETPTVQVNQYCLNGGPE